MLVFSPVKYEDVKRLYQSDRVSLEYYFDDDHQNIPTPEVFQYFTVFLFNNYTYGKEHVFIFNDVMSGQSYEVVFTKNKEGIYEDAWPVQL